MKKYENIMKNRSLNIQNIIKIFLGTLILNFEKI